MSAFVIWALVAGTAMFWGLRQWTQGPRAPDYTVPVGEAGLERGDLSRLLGAAPAQRAPAAAPTVEAASRFKLVGVVAPKQGLGDGTGVALITIDGKPPKAYRVGAVIEGDLSLRGVAMRSASVGPAGAAALFTLQLPVPPAATRSNLPPSRTSGLPDRNVPPPAAYDPQGIEGAPPPPMPEVDGTEPMEAVPIEQPVDEPPVQQ